MTNYNERLDKILRELDRGEYLDKGGVPGAKQAILDWHNKQIVAVLDRIEATKTIYKAHAYNDKGVLRTMIVTTAIPLDAIEAERARLKERDDDQL